MPVLLAEQSGNTANNGLGSRVGEVGGIRGSGLFTFFVSFLIQRAFFLFSMVAHNWWDKTGVSFENVMGGDARASK